MTATFEFTVTGASLADCRTRAVKAARRFFGDTHFEFESQDAEETSPGYYVMRVVTAEIETLRFGERS